MTVSGQATFPHTFLPITVRNVYLKLTMALLPLAIVGMWRGGIRAVLVVLVALASGVLTEFLADLLRDQPQPSGLGRNSRILYLTVLIAVLMPVSTPLPIVAAAAVAAIAIGIHLMGDIGVYYVQPVFVGLLIVAGSGLSTLPVTELALTGPVVQSIAASEAYRVLSEFLFDPLGMRVPPEALALLIDPRQGGGVSLGAAMIPILLVGATIVFGESLIHPQLVVSFFVAAVAVLLVSGSEVIVLLVRSNLLLVMIFALADPGIRPLHPLGMVIYGAVSGALGALLLVTAGATVPVVTALVLVGIFRPLLDDVIRRFR